MKNNDDPENADRAGPQYPSPGTIFSQDIEITGKSSTKRSCKRLSPTILLHSQSAEAPKIQ